MSQANHDVAVADDCSHEISAVCSGGLFDLIAHERHAVDGARQQIVLLKVVSQRGDPGVEHDGPRLYASRRQSTLSLAFRSPNLAGYAVMFEELPGADIGVGELGLEVMFAVRQVARGVEREMDYMTRLLKRAYVEHPR